MEPALIDTNIVSMFANGFVLVTNNRKHFERIKEITVEDWSED